MISSEVLESRFPVGSSARMMEGLLTKCSCNCNTLPLSTTQFIWFVMHPVAEANISQAFLARLFRASFEKPA